MLDPLNPEIRINQAFGLLNMGKFAEAEREYRQILAIGPTTLTAHGQLGVSVLLQGRVDEAAKLAEKEIAEWCREFLLAMLPFARGDRAKANAAALAYEKAYASFAAYQVAELYAYLGDADNAFVWLDRAFRQHDSGLQVARIDSLLVGLHHDSRWPEFLRRVGLSDEQLK